MGAVGELESIAAPNPVSVLCGADGSFITASAEFDSMNAAIMIDGSELRVDVEGSCELTQSGWMVAASVLESGNTFITMEGQNASIRFCLD